MLIQAPLGRWEYPVYPLGLATLAASMDSCKFNIRIMDANRVDPADQEAEIQEFQPEIIGLSLRNIDSQMRRDLFYYYLYFCEYLKTVRAWSPHAVIILGGSGFSLFPKQIMEQNLQADLGVYLEADTTFPQLLDQLSDPGSVPGVYYRENGCVMFSGAAALPDIPSRMLPRYDLLDPKPYEGSGGVGIQTKRGCPMKCVYCTYPHLNGTCFRSRDVDDVIAEITTLHNDFGVTEFTFVDGVFNLPKSRAVEIIDRIAALEFKITWRAWFTEKGFDQLFAERCRDTGCPEFSFSPDGFSPETLKALGKNISVADIERIYQIARDTDNIRVAFNFFWNPPDQTLGSFVKMLIFALKCKLTLGRKAGGIIFGNMRIEPGTPLWHRAVDDSVISPETNLLPSDVDTLEGTFYSNPGTRYLDTVFHLYTRIWRLKQRVSGAGGEKSS